MRTAILALAVILAVPLASAANGRVPLSKDPVLEAGLLMVAKGHIARKYCDRLSIRYFRAFGLMNSLKDRARELGYTDAEMRAYVDDKEQKKRVESKAAAELKAAGADVRHPETFCQVAQREIEADRDFGHYFTIH